MDLISIVEWKRMNQQVVATEQPVSRIKPTPKVGETLIIKHQVKRDNTGATVLGLQRNDRPIKSTITAVYLDGSVRDNHSDVWEVKPGQLGQWETVNPERERV
jgi:hypothetical protein